MTTRPADSGNVGGGGLAWRERLLETLQRRGAVVVLILVVALSALAFDNFLTAQNLENIVLQGAFLGLIVVGMTFVIISGGIDLSVGSMVGLGGVLAALTAQVFWPLALLLPPLLCGLIGFGNGLLIARAKMAPFIVTLAGLLGIRGLALALAPGQKPIGIDGGSPLTWFGQGQIFGVGVPVVFMIIAFVVGGLVLARTGYGRVVFAVGGSEESARLMGLPVSRTKVIAYTTSGALAGLAGALLAARLTAGDPNAGLAWELDAISAVVVGGTLLTGGAGSMSGSLAGVLLLSILQNLINQVGTLGSYAQQLVSGAFLIIVVVAQAYLTRKRRY
jgi:ribose/xylose/arabinose/galactoside ABC-type transport system permease subunit